MMNEAIEIINKWIAYAMARNLVPHTRHFWNARDIIEGTFRNEKTIRETIDFIESLDDTKQRNILLENLRSRNEND
jgi:hypothetical protein